MRLRGMPAALEEQPRAPNIHGLSFEEMRRFPIDGQGTGARMARSNGAFARAACKVCPAWRYRLPYVRLPGSTTGALAYGRVPVGAGAAALREWADRHSQDMAGTSRREEGVPRRLRLDRASWLRRPAGESPSTSSKAQNRQSFRVPWLRAKHPREKRGRSAGGQIASARISCVDHRQADRAAKAHRRREYRLNVSTVTKTGRTRLRGNRSFETLPEPGKLPVPLGEGSPMAPRLYGSAQSDRDRQKLAREHWRGPPRAWRSP